MSYQVLARKYRPTSFAALKGQDHISRALLNSLSNNKLHHAYLFLGTYDAAALLFQPHCPAFRLHNTAKLSPHCYFDESCYVLVRPHKAGLQRPLVPQK